jgi:hypothetical protein
MDTPTLLANGGVSASVILGALLLYRFWNNIVGHRLVSNCCGRKLELGIDVRDMESPVSPTKSDEQKPVAKVDEQ